VLVATAAVAWLVMWLAAWWSVVSAAKELRAARARLDAMHTTLQEHLAESRLANENLSEGFARMLGAADDEP